MGKNRRLRPFQLAGALSHCPECGATGDYALLKRKAQVVQLKLQAAKDDPAYSHLFSFASGRFPDLHSAINDLINVIDKEVS